MDKAILWLVAILFGAVAIVEAQQPAKLPKIGVLSPLSPTTHSLPIEAFRNGLRDLGYIEGKNITIEYRFAEGERARAFRSLQQNLPHSKLISRLLRALALPKPPKKQVAPFL
jgi:ABC-type uncharacterized transport system substrate-binding protein